MDEGADGGRSCVEELGDLVGRAVEVVAEHQGDALAVGEVLERLPHRRGLGGHARGIDRAGAGLGQALTERGLAFHVGRGGERLSGGQRQLVALTRTLLRSTPLIILDEPTSALDPASRDRVIACLRAWTSGRTIITVSHDTELIRQADEIRYIESGRLAGSGAFDGLCAELPQFRRTFTGSVS